MQGHSKSELHWLYNTVYDTNFYEKEKIFSYCNLRFWFGGTSHRNSEKLLLFVEIPAPLISDLLPEDVLPIENYLLSNLSPVINKLSQKYLNTDKNVREKAQFSAQSVNANVIKRNGLLYDKRTNCFILRINFNVPLVNALSVNAKSAIRAIRDILDQIENTLKALNRAELNEYVSVYSKQEQIRLFLKENNFCSFVADGSILPRENRTDKPMKNALPFVSPDNMRITISFSDSTTISGMGIKKGVTVITGGGYSGKSTLLDALEMGIYNHIPGDGREFCLSDTTALKIYTEDGRPVNNMDISPFFKYLPNDINIKEFSTLHASGSVSQAANVIEAVCGQSKLLLIDEDKSATNFMIRDANMRKVVKQEPIIPFTDRVRELYSEKGVSTVLVIGGSSEYLRYADTVILMDNYFAKNITEEVKTLDLPVCTNEETPAEWINRRFLIPIATNQPFLYFRTDSSKNTKMIVLDSYSADITLLTALVSENQLHSLTYMIEQVLINTDSNKTDLMQTSNEIVEKMYSPEVNNTIMSFDFNIERWFEAVRPIDIFCCANRMRGLEFQNS